MKKDMCEFLFDDKKMKRYLSRGDFASYLKVKEEGEELPKTLAKAISKGVKAWAESMGATHYCHWFLPLNGKTAQKQVSFIGRSGDWQDFSENSLIKGEADASSFPNGGARMTFEARGYTIWDYTSPLFIKEDLNGNRILCIPTAFCSYGGLALDEKTPLLRALELVSRQAKRVMSALGYKDIKKVICNVGAEQEYFLIKKEMFDGRLDLVLTGETLLGSRGIKSQEEGSHYFGEIDDEVSLIMNEVDRELWRMGILAKIQHNEVAPCQYELVPIFSQANISSDQNQIIMESISKISKKYGYVALFHEKPFAGVNGSGKHINISFSTDSGLNLLDVNMPDKNIFLTFFTAMIVCVDKYYKIIRSSTAYLGNDARLGGDEAPPSLISMFIGGLEGLIGGEMPNFEEVLDVGVKSLPKTIKDFCDRNRTSPFAYSGGKFEFRMVGSSQSIALPITAICTAYQEVLGEIADRLEGGEDLLKMLGDLISRHKRIIFNGNGYDNSWREGAKERGLVEIRESLTAYKVFDEEETIKLFSESGVLSREELIVRKNALVKRYVDGVILRAKTLCLMLNKQILPTLKKSICFYDGEEYGFKNQFVSAFNDLFAGVKHLENGLNSHKTDCEEFTKDILSTIKDIRRIYDGIEGIIPDMFKPFPDYNDIFNC